MEIRSIRTPGLGDATYLLTHEDEAILVDPQRDVTRFLAALEDRDVQLRWVLETHLHNDYVSGGREAAARTGAELVLPAAAVVPFQHTPAFHQEPLQSSRFEIRPLHTPGHTPEHTSYLVLIDGGPVALFSGGSLLVGSAGRPDLLGWDRARELAKAQYRSVHRLARLPEHVGLYPTHGEGSFCTASGAGRTTSTIGDEKATNPVLAYPDIESFVAGQLRDLQPYPRYYAHMGPINLGGPQPLPQRQLPELDPVAVHALTREVTVIDGRRRDRFAAGHIPGSIGIELGDQFGVWVGWVTPFDTPLVLVLDPDQDAEEAVVQLARIGYEQVRGILRGLDAWHELGLPMTSYRRVGPTAFARALADDTVAQALDVRAPGEWDNGHVEGTIHAYVPDLVDRVPADLDPSRPVWVICGSGYRTSIAASLLERHGFVPVTVDDGGVEDVLAAAPTLAAA